jgi:putative transposase
MPLNACTRKSRTTTATGSTPRRAGEVETRRKAFIRKWRLKCLAVADSLEEAGDKLFTFTRFPPSQWKSIRTSNVIERLHEEFKRRIKT